MLFVVAVAGPAFAAASPGLSTDCAGTGAAVPFARYVTAFNTESRANQIKLGTMGTAAHVTRAAALRSALRQEPGAAVLGSGLGDFKSALYHYKPFAVWVFALDPRRPHGQPSWGLGNVGNSQYNYDVVIVRASMAVIEEAIGRDENLPSLPPEDQGSEVVLGPLPRRLDEKDARGDAMYICCGHLAPWAFPSLARPFCGDDPQRVGRAHVSREGYFAGEAGILVPY